jgi:hypothetical protein
MQIDLDTIELKIQYSELLSSEIFNTLFNNFTSFKKTSNNCSLQIYQFYRYIDDIFNLTYELFFIGNTKNEFVFLELNNIDDISVICPINISNLKNHQIKFCKYPDEIILERTKTIIPNILENKYLQDSLRKTLNEN